MYADRVAAAGSKRSIRERLNGGTSDDVGRSRQSGLKRLRPNDDKWKHDLYDDEEEPQASNSRVGPKDLRLKLQKKASQQTYQSGRDSTVPDLREKLSGIVHLQPASTDMPKAKPVVESAKSIKKSLPSVEAPIPETKKVSSTTSSRKRLQPKSDSSVEGLLHSLGLEKYSITFQAEEVDMTALKHMGDEDLKALGIPMGPRKKILLALDSRS